MKPGDRVSYLPSKAGRKVEGTILMTGVHRCQIKTDTGDIILALRSKLTKIGETPQGEDIILHVYSPDYQAMGDCRVCGHDQHQPWHLLEKFKIEHDGFEGVVIGQYKTLEGKRGVVLQQTGTKVVHVYSERFIK
jgi:hypothetical protein